MPTDSTHLAALRDADPNDPSPDNPEFQQVLEALVRAARERGDTEVCLHAQTSAQGFYERLGFTPRGEIYAEVGIPHIEMFLDIRQ